MNEEQKEFNLAKRTLQFAKDIRILIKKLPRTVSNVEDVKQLVRSSGSVGANYIEANECLSKKDFRMRIMICRKEAKESAYWLELIYIDTSQINKERLKLMQEAIELTKIFGAIVEKSK